jgi:hypothetical protein
VTIGEEQTSSSCLCDFPSRVVNALFRQRSWECYKSTRVWLRSSIRAIRAARGRLGWYHGLVSLRTTSLRCPIFTFPDTRKTNCIFSRRRQPDRKGSQGLSSRASCCPSTQPDPCLRFLRKKAQWAHIDPCIVEGMHYLLLDTSDSVCFTCLTYSQVRVGKPLTTILGLCSIISRLTHLKLRVQTHFLFLRQLEDFSFSHPEEANLVDVVGCFYGAYVCIWGALFSLPRMAMSR